MANQVTIIRANDGKNIFCRSWLPLEGEPQAVIILAHGMTEHSQRYDDFGAFLVANGMGLVCHDQRGHGLTGRDSGEIGHLPLGIGWHFMVDDLAKVADVVRQDYRGPLFLMGHSMGSFVARCFVQQNSGIFDGLILSGTGGDPGKMGFFGQKLARLNGRIFGEKTRSDLLNKLIFGLFNQPFAPVRTNFDWLSGDAQAVDGYCSDELCGFVCTNGFYHELLEVNLTANTHERNLLVEKTLPIYMFSGGEDPVGKRGVGVKQVYEDYLACGVMDVTCHIYPGGRHEMLNECNKQAVYEALLVWLKKHS